MTNEDTEEEVFTYLSNDIELPNFNVHQTSKDWVNYGDNWRDNFGTRLMDLYNNSALHQAIIDSSSEQISGGGFIALDKDEKEIDLSTIVNKKGETLDDVLIKVSKDKRIGGIGYLTVTWSNDWKSIADFNHYDFTKMRMAKVDNKGQIPGVFYAFNWNNTRAKSFIPMFNHSQAKKNSKQFKAYEQQLGQNVQDIDKINLPTDSHIQVIVIRNYSPDSFYYPYPSYKGALNAIESDIEADKYGMFSLKNGMDPSMVVNIKANPKDKVKNRTARKFLKSYQGAKNSGKPIITFTGKDDEPPIITQLKAPDVDKRYVVINENVQQKILSAHRVPNPILVGIMTPGKLGGVKELRDAQELFNNLVIKPEQKLIAKEFKKVLPYFKEIQDVEELSIKSNNPISFTWSEDVLKEILTEDEMREEISREPKAIEEVEEVEEIEEDNEDVEEEVKMSRSKSIKSFISGIFNKFKS